MQGVIYWGYKMKYLLAIFLGCSVVFGFLSYYYHNRADSYCELWKNSQANIDYLVQKRREDNEKTIQIAERNRELEAEAEKDKPYFDWSSDISNTSVILRLKGKQ